MEIAHKLSCLLHLLISLIVHRLGRWLCAMQNMGHLSSCCGSPLSQRRQLLSCQGSPLLQSQQHHWSFHASLLQRRLNMIRHPDVTGSQACLWLERNYTLRSSSMLELTLQLEQHPDIQFLAAAAVK
jgi:hypothetical protein